MSKFINLVLNDGRNIIIDATGIEVTHQTGEDRVIVETKNKSYTLSGGERTFQDIQIQLSIFIKNPKGTGTRSKQVSVNGRVFPSVKAAAAVLGISQSALSLRLRNPTEDLYFL